MQNKICLIHHFAGIGDVFFLQYVARKYMAMGYHVVWPLKDEILWIKDYIPDIEFCSREFNFLPKITNSITFYRMMKTNCRRKDIFILNSLGICSDIDTISFVDIILDKII